MNVVESKLSEHLVIGLNVNIPLGTWLEVEKIHMPEFLGPYHALSLKTFSKPWILWTVPAGTQCVLLTLCVSTSRVHRDHSCCILEPRALRLRVTEPARCCTEVWGVECRLSGPDRFAAGQGRAVQLGCRLCRGCPFLMASLFPRVPQW